MTSLTLKMIALITMIIDHYGAIFQTNALTFRIIGRLAFPIYCFLIVEGFFHTRDIKKYASKLFILALVSELPFDYAFFSRIYWGHQNIFFTLFIGLISIALLEKYKNKNHLYSLLIIISAASLASLLKTDYSFIGIIYILAFYKARNFGNLNRILIVGSLIFLTNYLSSNYIQQFSLLALVLIFFYNKKPGLKVKTLQILFYISYPLHLCIFALIKYLR